MESALARCLETSVKPCSCGSSLREEAELKMDLISKKVAQYFRSENCYRKTFFFLSPQMQKRESFTINEQGLGIGKNELFIILVLQMGIVNIIPLSPMCCSGIGRKKKARLVYLSGVHHKCQVRPPHDMLPASHFILSPLQFPKCTIWFS